MTKSFETLERTLHDGPPDEAGYRALLPAFEQRPVDREGIGLTPVARVIDMPRLRPTQPLRLGPIAAMLAVAVAVGGIALVMRDRQPSVIGPMASERPAVSPPPSGSPASSPTASPSEGPLASSLPTTSPIPIPALTLTFVSPRNGFSIGYAADWTVTPATRSWPPDTFPARNELDRLSAVDGPRLTVASQALAPGQTESEWVAAYFQPYQGEMTCPNETELAQSPRLPIDGRSGYLHRAGCPLGADAVLAPGDVGFEAFVFAGDRVYEIDFEGQVDRAFFDALLATMRLDPSSALDPS